jgi:hypothetical protein
MLTAQLWVTNGDATGVQHWLRQGGRTPPAQRLISTEEAARHAWRWSTSSPIRHQAAEEPPVNATSLMLLTPFSVP